MKKILIIDDDIKICELIKEFFEEDFEIIMNNDGYDLVSQFVNNKFSLVIVDVDLGHIDGFTIYSEISKYYDGPIIFLSGNYDIEYRLKGLELGADDYICKPFNFQELKYKVMRLIERSEKATFFEIANYRINNEEKKVYKDGVLLKLADTPTTVLIQLLKNYNKVLSRKEIYINAWGYDDNDPSRLVDHNISIVRKVTNDGRIKNVRGIGYTFDIN